MVVRPEDLSNPEQGLDLSTRDAKAAKKNGKPSAEDELRVLRERIAAARATTPRDPIPHCGDCFRRGWEAGLRALDG